jgi:hypothetical protein
MQSRPHCPECWNNCAIHMATNTETLVPVKCIQRSIAIVMQYTQPRQDF